MSPMIGIGLGLGLTRRAGGGVPAGYLALRYLGADGSYRPLVFKNEQDRHTPIAYLKAD